MSWESTQHYYRAINEGVNARLGKLHSARVVLLSVDFQPIEQLQQAGDWTAMAESLAADARRVEAAGADCLIICTNTMHKVADAVQAAVDIPLLHIADATGAALSNDGLSRIALLGTAFTMEQDFYRKRLQEVFNLDVLVPSAAGRAIVHRVIYEELCKGEISADSRTAYLRIIEELAGRGAEAVILGCTEIGMLVSQPDTAVPLYDTTAIHAARAVEFALAP